MTPERRLRQSYLDAVEKLVTSGTAAVANLIVSPDGASVTIDGWTNRDR
jgi:hypothetical protein